MTGDVDQLPCDEMVSRKFSSDVQQRVISDTEFSNLQLGFNFRFGAVAALRLGDIFWFRGAGTELESYLAILFGITAGNDQIGRAPVCTPVTTAIIVSRILL